MNRPALDSLDLDGLFACLPAACSLVLLAYEVAGHGTVLRKRVAEACERLAAGRLEAMSDKQTAAVVLTASCGLASAEFGAMLAEATEAARRTALERPGLAEQGWRLRESLRCASK